MLPLNTPTASLRQTRSTNYANKIPRPAFLIHRHKRTKRQQNQKDFRYSARGNIWHKIVGVRPKSTNRTVSTRIESVNIHEIRVKECQQLYGFALNKYCFSCRNEHSPSPRSSQFNLACSSFCRKKLVTFSRSAAFTSRCRNWMTTHCCGITPRTIPRKPLPRSSRGTSTRSIRLRCATPTTRIRPRR